MAPDRASRRRTLRWCAALTLLVAIAPPQPRTLSAGDDPDELIQIYMRDTRTKKPPERPSERMYSKNGIIYCTGSGRAAELNNRAADLIAAGANAEAKAILARGLERAPLFFPFVYNAGLCCLFLREYEQGLIYFRRASDLLPEYPKTYLQMGYINEMKGLPDEAIAQYRRALGTNAKELDSFILIGDIYYNRNRIDTAEKYYRASLKIDPLFSNGIIGVAKIHFYRKEYHSCIVVIKSVDLESEYDRALHYYYAESAYKLLDYKTATEQYRRLLEFKSDKFFITHPRSLIQHKLDLASRFVSQ